MRTEIDAREWALAVMDLNVLLWRMVVEGSGNLGIEKGLSA